MEQTVGNALRTRAEHAGDDPFLISGPEDRIYTYTEVNDLTNSVAHSLSNQEIDKGSRVSVIMGNHVDTALLMLGVNKQGAIYAPTNYDLKGEPLAYQINDTHPDVIVIDQDYVPRLDEVWDRIDSRPEVIVRRNSKDTETDRRFEAEIEFQDLLENETDEVEESVQWDDTASIMYTSGTTGKPKGVILPYRWIFSNYSVPSSIIIGSDDRVHNSLPLYHVAGAYVGIIRALIVGGSVVQWPKFSSSEFWNRIDQYGASSTALMSVMIPWMTKQPEREDDHRNTLNKVIMAPLPNNYRELADRFGFDIVLSVYGSTESGVPTASAARVARGDNATPETIRRGKSPAAVEADLREQNIPVFDAFPVAGDDDGSEFPIYVGKPWQSSVEVAILNERDEEMGPGEAGEIAIRPNGPAMLFSEYFAKPEKTVEATRNYWYHTGDIGYRDEEDGYFFLDRKGGVIRRRGENISSMQIEDIVNDLDLVEKSAAFPIPATEGGEDEIGIAVETDSAQSVSEEALRSRLDESLPHFMAPDRLWQVEEMPTTQTNKVAKDELIDQLDY